MKKIVKKAIKICIFIIIVNLPFISLTQIIGMNTFLDSFENPDSYIFLDSQKGIIGTKIENGQGIFIQKSSHPQYSLKEGDRVIYYQDNGEIVCDEINQINSIGFIEKYHMDGDNNKLDGESIYKHQIVGKVISIVDDNIWTEISMKIWDVSIHDLNVRALFADN